MIIRQTPLQGLDTTTATLTDLKAELDHQTEVAVTGVEVLAPHDAPGGWIEIDRLQGALADQDVYLQNGQTASAILDTAEVALSAAADAMVEAKEVAIALASESYTDEDRAEAAVQIDGLYDTLIALANTDIGGRYVFAGTAYDSPAFATDGTYQGTAEVPSVIIGDGAVVPTGFDGAVVFSDALQTLTDLAAAMRSGPGSSSAMAAILDPMDAAHDTLVDTRQQLGYHQLEVSDASGLATSLKSTLTEALNARVAADPIEALTALAELQSAYEVALQVTATSSDRTLFDFLR